ncbi:vacuolar protein sorting-associated protein 32-like protein 2-like protein [Neoconidiobolus thromboides FSU 785]|nr:vacuolar protein sorting-associated protein 32-like protein 2-like protein [Neoconidiobolus thromboides FSU 785]
MDWFFGKPRAQNVAKESITKLRENSLLLEKREQHLQKLIDQEVIKAKKFIAESNKRKALEALKRKKQWEDQINKIGNTRLNIDTLLMTIENSKIDLETVNVMKQGASAMKAMQKEMKIEKVEDVMDDVRDQMSNANTISEALSESIDVGMEYDEDDLMKELEEFETDLIDQQLEEAQAPPVSLPATSEPVMASTHSVKADKEEMDEFAELQAEMAS